MKLFIIHVSNDRSIAKKQLKKLAKNLSIDLQNTFLSTSNEKKWKQKALKAINEAEAIIVFNPSACNLSRNTKWEIDKAETAGKEIIPLLECSEIDELSKSKILSLYHFEKEFCDCFLKNNDKIFELYKLMIDSSESLIHRRQKTNAFFITAISALLTIAGFLVKTGAINSESISILYIFSIISLLLCNSWRNIIDNYGKLNKAKFDVILNLEKNLSAQIYSAEWVSLGKGIRPKKYKSFTSTEKNVPLFFAILITMLTLVIVAKTIVY